MKRPYHAMILCTFSAKLHFSYRTFVVTTLFLPNLCFGRLSDVFILGPNIKCMAQKKEVELKASPLIVESWDTRTRTKNDRTRICSVTITPYPNFARGKRLYRDFKVGILGLEPRMTGPESVVLPLHHIPILLSQLVPLLRVQRY